MAFARLEIRIEGEDIVAAALERYEKEAQTLIENVLVENAKMIAGKAKSRAPQGKTGRLRRSIRAGKDKSQGPMAAYIRTKVYYAPYQEFGTGSGARVYVPTLPTEIQRIALFFKRPPTPRNPNISPKKFLWNSVVDQQPTIIKSVRLALQTLELR